MKMNSCRFSSRVIAYQLGLLNKQEMEEFKDHLGDCQFCKRELQIQHVINQELSFELQPGRYTENLILNRLKLDSMLNGESFWMYRFRVLAYALAGIIALFALTPWFMRLPFDKVFRIDFFEISILTCFNSLSFFQLSLYWGFGMGVTLFIASTIYALIFNR